jgi:DNA primase
VAQADGGKGLHLMAPLDRKMDHDHARAYAKRIAQRLAATAPDRHTLAAALGKRAGHIFIDYLRNGRGTTAIGAWSPRARAGFPIAAPVSWRQVENGIWSGRLHDDEATAPIARGLGAHQLLRGGVQRRARAGNRSACLFNDTRQPAFGLAEGPDPRPRKSFTTLQAARSPKIRCVFAVRND